MKRNLLKATSFVLVLMVLCLCGCSKKSSTETTSVATAPVAVTETTPVETAPVVESVPEVKEVKEVKYLYGYTPMSFADFWYGEMTEVEECNSFDASSPDLTAQSEEYLHFSYSNPNDVDIYAGVQKNTWDNDSGMYDEISRATVGYGLFRAGFAHTVEVTMDNGEKKIMTHEIVEDSAAPTGYRIDLNNNNIDNIFLTSNTRLDTKKSKGYTPDTNTTYANSVANGGGGYKIVGLKKVPVMVKSSTVEEALALQKAGKADDQVKAFLNQYEKITFEENPTAYAYKELYANGVYGERVINENAAVKNPGKVYLGDGSKGTKPIAHGDGYADLTMFVYYENYDGYTRGSVGSLDEKTLDTLYEGDKNPTYAANKENADKLAAFMDYALHFQGAKLQWAGKDDKFDTADDVVVGEMLHKDAYFSFNHGNYIEISITNDFERFSKLGNGYYRITMIADGYKDVSVETDKLILDYHTPTIWSEDVPAVGLSKLLSVQINAEGVNVSLDENVQSEYLSALEKLENYSLYYMKGSGRKAKAVTVCDKADLISIDDNIYTITFDVSNIPVLTEDIHYFVNFDSGIMGIAPSQVEFHYAPKD
ncbi:MAG: hypothetical protein K6G51_04415 [Sphaerochaetaceae bacterium]|nr:hypothetical protein [Sphaerochaetaceae bacterium]